jgi:hypothetical protein
MAFDEEAGLLMVVCTTVLMAYQLVDEALNLVASRHMPHPVVYLEHVPSRGCFVAIDNGSGSGSGGGGVTVSIMCVESKRDAALTPAQGRARGHNKSDRRVGGGDDGAAASKPLAFGDVQILSSLELLVGTPADATVDACFDHTKAELAIAICDSAAHESGNQRRSRGIHVYSLRRNESSKKAPYRLTQRLQIEAQEGLVPCAVAYDEVLGHLIGLCSDGTVCIWEREQGVLKQAMGKLLDDPSDGGLFVGHGNGLILTFPAQQPHFNAWMDEFQCTRLVKGNAAPTEAFATTASNRRNHAAGRKRELQGAAALAPQALDGDDDVTLATLDKSDQLTCWHVTLNGVRCTASISLQFPAVSGSTSGGGGGSGGGKRASAVCFIRQGPAPPSAVSSSAQGNLFIAVAVDDSLLLVRLHGPAAPDSCLQQVATLPAAGPARAAQLSIESKPPLSDDCDADNEAVLYGTVAASGDGDALPSATGGTGVGGGGADASVSRSRAGTPLRPAPLAVAGPSTLRMLTVSTHGIIRTSDTTMVGAAARRTKLPPHSRIGVNAAVAAKARVTCTVYNAQMSCVLVGWNTGFVDVVHVPQGARLRTLLPAHAKTTGASSSETTLEAALAVSCVGVIPRHHDPVGEKLGRSVVLAGQRGGCVSAWSLSSYDFDAEVVPTRLHATSAVSILVWRAASPPPPSSSLSSSSSSSSSATTASNAGGMQAGPPSTLVVTASAGGEVKVWTVECVDASVRAPLSSGSSLRRSSTNSAMGGGGVGAAAAGGGGPADGRPTSLRWTLRGFFQAKGSKAPARRLTTACQLSVTSLAVG